MEADRTGDHHAAVAWRVVTLKSKVQTVANKDETENLQSRSRKRERRSDFFTLTLIQT